MPIPDEDSTAGVAEAITPLLGPSLAAQRLTLTLLPAVGRMHHLTFEHVYGNGAAVMREDRDLHGIHPETAARIDLARLRKFDVERLEAPEDLYCFHARSPEIPGDERLLVLADVRGRSPDEADGREAPGPTRHPIGRPGGGWPLDPSRLGSLTTVRGTPHAVNRGVCPKP